MAADPEVQALVAEVFPALAKELHDLLVADGGSELATQIPSLKIVDRCRCGDDFCGMFYVLPKPKDGYGPTHRNVDLDTHRGTLILDVVDEKIAAVEVLYRNEIKGCASKTATVIGS